MASFCGFDGIRREVLRHLKGQLARARQDARAIRRRLNELRTALRAQERRVVRCGPDATGLPREVTMQELASLRTRIEEAETTLTMAVQGIQSQKRQIHHLSAER